MASFSAEKWQQLSPYLDEAFSLPEEERARWLEALATREPALAAMLKPLLAEHEELAKARFLEAGPTLVAGEDSRAGQTVGAYRLTSPIGRGGMGTVWLAERSDGRFQRQVAVKFLDPAIAAHDGSERFKREGSILARLAHPHIAELIDAGVTEKGQPFLVLEYVDGEPIDQYCNQHALSVEQRLRLFLDVLDAAAQAHANLIVHRDIKPSNVFVRRDGQIKLLDFGIAKLLTDGNVLNPGLTIEGTGALTPQFAAPEQISGTTVTTATDVYALGVLLYMLLTGQHPAGKSTTTPADLVKAIIETEPPKASEIATAGVDADPVTNDKLRRQLRGDLDTILAKALKKNPQERYASVTLFADDLRRYLEHIPISARPDSISYRVRKFVERNRALVVLSATALVLTIASLAAGIYISNRQRVIAEQRFEQLQKLSTDIFELDKDIRNLPGSMQARQRLVAAALQYLDGLAADAHGNPDIMRETAVGYWRVGRVQGVPTELNLGEPVKAEASLKHADELLDQVLAARPRDRRALLNAATVAHDRMILAQTEHRDQDAIQYGQKSAIRLDTLLQLGIADDDERKQATSIYLNIALANLNMHRYSQALPFTQRSIEIAQASQSIQFRAAQAYSLQASAMRFEGRLNDAWEAIQLARKLSEVAVYPSEVSRAMDTYGILLRQGLLLGENGAINLGRPHDAIEPLQKAFDMNEDMARREAKDAMSRTRLATSANALANMLRAEDPKRAFALYEHSLHRLDEANSSVPLMRLQAQILANSSYALCQLHRAEEAKRRIESAITILGKTNDYPAKRLKLDGEVYAVYRARADYEASNGDARRAGQYYDELLGLVTAGNAAASLPDLPDATRLSYLYEAMANFYMNSGDRPKAAEIANRRHELWSQWDQKLPDNDFIHRQLAASAKP